MLEVTLDDLLIHYPLVREDAPEWKKICPFCGAVDMVHEDGNTYICHECHANWLENDTETERHIQVLSLNGGTMPKPGEGEMPIVFCTLMEKPAHEVHINLQDETVTFVNSEGKIYAVRDLQEWLAELLKEGEKLNVEYACA